MTKKIERTEELPEFFRGMEVAYADCAEFIEKMRDNLPPELKMLEGGFDTMANGVRQKITELHIAVEQHRKKAPTGEGEAKQ